MRVVHLVAFIERRGTGFVATRVETPTRHAAGAAVRAAQYEAGGVPLARQNIRYWSTHADSGVITMKQEAR